MIKNFFGMKQEGKTICEIADYYNLTTRTIYLCLQEIADNNGVSRDDLLDKKHKPYEVKNIKSRRPSEKVDAEELVNHFSSMIEEIDNIVFILDDFLKRNEVLMEET